MIEDVIYSIVIGLGLPTIELGLRAIVPASEAHAFPIDKDSPCSRAESVEKFLVYLPIDPKHLQVGTEYLWIG